MLFGYNAFASHLHYLTPHPIRTISHMSQVPVNTQSLCFHSSVLRSLDLILLHYRLRNVAYVIHLQTSIWMRFRFRKTKDRAKSKSARNSAQFLNVQGQGARRTIRLVTGRILRKFSISAYPAAHRADKRMKKILTLRAKCVYGLSFLFPLFLFLQFAIAVGKIIQAGRSGRYKINGKSEKTQRTA